MKSMTKKVAKGFTLIELLIVIGIVAILAVGVVLTLNPAELLKQARDSTRISDFATLRNAIALYLSDVETPALVPDVTLCYTHKQADGSDIDCTGRFNSPVGSNSSSSRAVNGTGWLPIAFSGISSGEPFSNLPVDPTRNSTYFYAYMANAIGVYELNVEMESSKFEQGGSSNVESTDGGDTPQFYEVGAIPGLNF